MSEHEDPPRQRSILVVDDDCALAGVVVDLLEEEGISATAVENVDDAIERLRMRRFDAILSDIQMPRKDGFKLLEEVLAIEPDSCVIMMSTADGEKTVTRVKQEGGFDLLPKPFRRADLLSILKQALDEE